MELPRGDLESKAEQLLAKVNNGPFLHGYGLDKIGDLLLPDGSKRLDPLAG